MVERTVQTKSKKGFYNFSTKTLDEAPTGNWSAQAKIGNINFYKNINIESTKPNRLKINLNINNEFLEKGKPTSATLTSNWLHGATARNLKADVTAAFTNKSFSPEGYEGFIFFDPSRLFYTEEIRLYDGTLNENGTREFSISSAPSGFPPSELRATFATRVFEEGGEYSIDRFTIPCYPYSSFTGIRVPEGNKWGWPFTDTSHVVDVVTLDPRGNPVSINNLEVSIYKIKWRWWWDSSEDNLASYVSGSYKSVVFQEKISTIKGKSRFSFKINKPALVEDPETILQPVLTNGEQFKPESKATVSVSEKSEKDMAYTVAIVDEGLLDLTRFKTPDPHKTFYAREALGVKTWDLYDYVLGAYGGRIEQIFNMGGDGEFELEAEPKKANRLKPMVKFIGPVILKAGKTNTHAFDIPRYIGSVRIMVIAGNGHAYGSADKTIPVKNELMVLATLPRVVGPGEHVKMPVTVFAMDDKIKKVNLKAFTNELFKVALGREKETNR